MSPPIFQPKALHCWREMYFGFAKVAVQLLLTNLGSEAASFSRVYCIVGCCAIYGMDSNPPLPTYPAHLHLDLWDDDHDDWDDAELMGFDI